MNEIDPVVRRMQDSPFLSINSILPTILYLLHIIEVKQGSFTATGTREVLSDKQQLSGLYF